MISAKRVRTKSLSLSLNNDFRGNNGYGMGSIKIHTYIKTKDYYLFKNIHAFLYIYR